jgi:hypothetical protein
MHAFDCAADIHRLIMEAGGYYFCAWCFVSTYFRKSHQQNPSNGVRTDPMGELRSVSVQNVQLTRLLWC